MITNTTKTTILAHKTLLRKGILGKAIGLMFHKRLEDTAMIFLLKKEMNVTLHMFFVFYPIDVLYLNPQKEVVEITSLKPSSIYKPKNKAKYIIELYQGAIKKTDTEIGDIVEFYLREN